MTEPALYQYRTKPTWHQDYLWSDWKDCSEANYNDYIKTPLLHDWVYETRKLFAEPFDIEPPRYAKRLINQLREQLAEQTALVTKWHTMAVELDQIQQQMTDLLRSEREEHNREVSAYMKETGELRRVIHHTAASCQLAADMCDADSRGQLFAQGFLAIKQKQPTHLFPLNVYPDPYMPHNRHIKQNN